MSKNAHTRCTQYTTYKANKKAKHKTRKQWEKCDWVCEPKTKKKMVSNRANTEEQEKKKL